MACSACQNQLFFVGGLPLLCHRQCLKWTLDKAVQSHSDALDALEEMARLGPAVEAVSVSGKAVILPRQRSAVHERHQEQLPFVIDVIMQISDIIAIIHIIVS